MRYLIWDFDGTLGYRDGGWSGALFDVLRDNGLADGISAADIRPHLLTGFRWHSPSQAHPPALPADQWWKELEPLFAVAFAAVAGLPNTRAVLLASQVRSAYLNPTPWQLYQDTLPALRSLSQGYQHLILSNHVPELSQILHHLNVQPHLCHVINSAETGFEKPHPQSYACAIADLPSGADVTMVGDNPNADFAGARQAGLKAILVRRFTPGLTPYYSSLTDFAEALAGNRH